MFIGYYGASPSSIKRALTIGIAGIILGTYLGRRRAKKEGLIRQVGKTGRHVYYEKIDGSTELSTRQ